MRTMKTALVISLLVLLGACAPQRYDGWHRGDQYRGGHHGGAMMGGCGPGSCTYRSRCFSNGAIHPNGGACQACTDGRWVAATGCRDDGRHPCGMMKGKKGPCCEHCPMYGGKPPARGQR
jgi:hypothetical protein